MSIIFYYVLMLPLSPISALNFNHMSGVCFCLQWERLVLPLGAQSTIHEVDTEAAILKTIHFSS